MDHYCDFPFEEHRTKTDSDLFDSVQEALDAGWLITQIWSVVVCDDDDEPITWTYGPNHHWVNVMGFTATQEHHDGDTYYHECDA
tara:strand:+ start:267 stop:521 length:255 start_codon:yes stop_codon:yes gene_type:complete